jgi:DNA processing protein
MIKVQTISGLEVLGAMWATAHDPFRLTDERRKAARKLGIDFVGVGEVDYPRRLQMIDDPPPLIAVRGHRDVFAMPQVAIVGSRNASADGIKLTQCIVHELGKTRFAIVSGLARGIDAAAYRASLATGTIAVLAGGHDRISPPEHASLLDDILPNGAALTEMPLGWEPQTRDFPRRNRLISGLSLGVVIVEAAKRSGSLICRCFSRPCRRYPGPPQAGPFPEGN